MTGTETYHGFTPYDTRTPGIDTMTVGWFASLFPVTVPTGTGSFHEAARAAQNSFDANKHLASVPVDRVLELAASAQLEIKPPTRPAMMMSFIDFRKIPVSDLWEETNFGIYGDNLNYGEINVWINRHATRTTVTVSYPGQRRCAQIGSPLHRDPEPGVRGCRPDHRGLDRTACPPCEFERTVRCVHRKQLTRKDL